MMVFGKEDKQSKTRQDKIDRWLEKFFLDPLTSYLDEAAFRLDLFETADEYIIEALLPAYEHYKIEVILEDNNITIRVYNQNLESGMKQRLISFPFLVIEHQISAQLNSNVLEVSIAKSKFPQGKNRKILIVK